MSENKKRRPILYNGQVYGEPVTKGGGGGTKAMPYTYEQAREIILNDINETREVLRNMPDSARLPNEIILSLTLQPEFSAKSYYPETLFDLGYEKFGLTEIGSRVWRNKNYDTNKITDVESEEYVAPTFSKMFFIRATEESLIKFENQLKKSSSTLTKSFQTDIRKISNLGILPTNEQILGLPDDWQQGRLEAVLHPFGIDKDKSLEHFINHISKAGVNTDDVKFKQYRSGVSFISFNGNKHVLDSLLGYNPLRTIHPLKMRDLPAIARGTSLTGGPNIPKFTKKSKTVIGVIDGGLDDSNPYTKNYSESEFSVSGSPIPGYVEHGTQVTGAVLYGPLNNYSTGDTLPEPLVSVKTFGVLSSNTNDPELYDAIDAIEKIIPSNKGIKVYNLSLGPSGPILDDSISRFTYSCDLLSIDHEVLFCVAVGNDGHVKGYERIQSPSDAVNCLAVGAFTNRKGVSMRAPYSSIGPGREGSKMKPDIMAFGGCDQYPIHLVSQNLGSKVWSQGTSFASPIAASLAGRLVGESNSTVDTLTAKALMIHSARDNNLNGSHCLEMGHGIIPDEMENIISCNDKSYTLIYRGELDPAKYAEFLIPWDENITKGKANFKWTVAVLTDIDQLSSDDYTTSSVEVAFYPNRNKYVFKNNTGIDLDGDAKKSEIVDILKNPERMEYLLLNGWEQSNFPQTDSAKPQFRTELELKEDLKWDSLDAREVTKFSKSIDEPVFHIHALGRGNRNGGKKVKFALILTVTTPKAEVDLYANILNKYSALIPLQIDIEARSEVVVKTDSDN